MRRGVRDANVPLPAVAELLPIRRQLVSLDPGESPQAAQVCGTSLRDANALVAVAGSFNPPHLAHLALLRAGLAATPGALGAFLLSVRTVDKERVTGILLEDRLWLLCRLLPDVGDGAAVLALNRGLYVEQAAALRASLLQLRELVFVVGFDKMVQILDTRYYQDREAALRELFGIARFLVAPRDHFTVADVRRLLAEPENRRYADRVTTLPLDPALATVSSTDARSLAGTGQLPSSLVPPLVERFVLESGCFSESGQERYAQRAAALNALAPTSS